MKVDSPTGSEVLDRVKKAVEATLRIPYDRIDADASFRDFGMDSIIALEVVARLSKDFSISLSPAQFAQVATVQELADQIAGSCEVTEKASSKKTATPSKPSIPVASPPEVKQVATVPHARGRRRVRKNHVTNTNVGMVVSKVAEQYGIHLNPADYGSADEVIDSLLENHLDGLLQHFESTESQEPRGFRTTGILPTAGSGGDVAVVGISCRFPDAPDIRAFWTNLMERKCSIREVPSSRWKWTEHYAEKAQPGKTYSKWAALVDDVDCFDPEFFNIPPTLAKLIDPQERLLIQEVYRALEDAGMDAQALRGSDTGVFVGYEYLEYEQYIRKSQFLGKLSDVPPITSASLNFYLANRLSYLFDLRGPSESINVNCASSAIAITKACNTLLLGESTVAIAAGVSLNLFEDDYIALSQQKLFSANGRCGVFDNNADGYTRGEGIGVLVLKNLQDAQNDNDRVYAVIKSCSQNNRGYANSISEIKHESITEVINSCCRKASVDVNTIRYIELNGYATKWGDAFEFEGIKNVFKGVESKNKFCALGSLKGNIGHLEPANGIAAVIKVALSMHNRKFPSTITRKVPSEFIDLDNKGHPLYFTDNEIDFRDIRNGNLPIRAGVSSFADSGTNVHVLMEEYQASVNAYADTDLSLQRPHLFLLSATDLDRLQVYADEFIQFLSGSSIQVRFDDMIYTLQTGRRALGCRLAIIASSCGEVLEKLEVARRTGMKPSDRLEREGIFCGFVDGTGDSSAARLISKVMSDVQLKHAVKTGEWSEAAILWLNGVTLSWSLVWEASSAKPVSLPGYPFARKRCWLDPSNNQTLMVKADSTLGAEGSGKQSSPKDEEYVAPNNLIEKKLLAIWARILDLEEETIGVNHGFFDMGGDSQQALRLVEGIKSQFGVALSPTVLFTAPNVASLGLVLENQSKPSADLLIPINSAGSRETIYGMPGAGGSVVCLQPISHALGTDQPFFGLQAVGLDYGTPLNSIEAMAQVNIEAIRTIQPKGPYRLLGYSNGGVVAYEMARQLIECGERITSLTFLDSVCPLERINDESEEMAMICTNLLSTLGANVTLDAEKLKEIPKERICGYLYELMSSHGFELTEEQFSRSFEVIMASDKCCRLYKPQKINRKLQAVLFRANQGYEGLPNDYGWNRVLASPIDVHVVEADHLSIISEAAVETVAQIMQGACGKPGSPKANAN